MAILSPQQIAEMGFASVGSSPRLSDRASYYNCENIVIGDHVRIDDYCVLSAGDGGICIGDYVHLAVYCSLIGAGPIRLGDFSGLSSRVAIYSSNDDYSGDYLVGPQVPAEFTNVHVAEVNIGRHVVVGAGAVVLPGVDVGEGAAVGALSLVSKSLAPFTVYSGVPARRVSVRSRDCLQREQELRAAQDES